MSELVASYRELGEQLLLERWGPNGELTTDEFIHQADDSQMQVLLLAAIAGKLDRLNRAVTRLTPGADEPPSSIADGYLRALRRSLGRETLGDVLAEYPPKNGRLAKLLAGSDYQTLDFATIMVANFAGRRGFGQATLGELMTWLDYVERRRTRKVAE